jgi:hypothetical protein
VTSPLGAYAEETRQMLLEEYFRNAPLCDLVEPWEWHTLPGYRKGPRPKAKRPSSFDTPLNPPPEGVPRYVMARDLAGTVFPASADLILREARRHGVGRKMGRTIIFSLPQDVQHLYEVLPCPSGSFAAPNPRIGLSAAPSGASALKRVLEQLTDASPKKSAPTARAKSSPNPSTVVALPARSQKPR